MSEASLSEERLAEIRTKHGGRRRVGLCCGAAGPCVQGALLAEVARLTEERDALELTLARLADWVCEHGGWRAFYYSTTPPPDGVFDLSDQINPDISDRLQSVLDAARPVPEEGGQ